MELRIQKNKPQRAQRRTIKNSKSKMQKEEEP
jgi:hypothetical protein